MVQIPLMSSFLCSNPKLNIYLYIYDAQVVTQVWDMLLLFIWTALGLMSSLVAMTKMEQESETLLLIVPVD